MILIRNTLSFINLLISKNAQIMSEFYDSCKIESYFESLIQKIKNKEFNIYDTNYEVIMGHI